MTATISDIKRTDGRAVTVRAAGGIELAEAELKSGGRVEGFRRRRLTDRQTDRQTTRRMRDVSREVIISVGGGRQKQDRKSSERRLIDR